MDWWSIFQKVASSDSVEKATGRVTGWKIDLAQSLAAFQLYGITDSRFGMEMLDYIESCLRDDEDLDEEFILYGETPNETQQNDDE